MKKIIICSIPMKEDPRKCRYPSDIRSLPTSDKEVMCPINAYLETISTPDDEFKLILLVKNDGKPHSANNLKTFMEEFCAATGKTDITPIVIETEFKQGQDVYEQLMGKIVDVIDADSYVLADVTYGPKDIPVAVFAALAFAKNHLRCDIEHVIYGQAHFEKGIPGNTGICDMVALLYMVTITSTIRSNDPQNAKELLKTLIS